MRPLFIFRKDPTIAVFRPHVAPTSSERACCWAGQTPISEAGAALLGLGGVRRLHAIEAGWLERVRACRLYAYEFDPAPFKTKVAEAGYWVTREEVAPLAVTPVGDLLAQHVEAGIKMRIVRNLWRLIDAIVASGLEFSIIRKANAQQRLASM